MKSYRQHAWASAMGMVLATCISGCQDSGSNTGNETPAPNNNTPNSSTLIQKLAVTAIPNAAVSMRSAVTAAVATQCVANAPTDFAINGGKVWISQAYVIVDEVEFDREPSTTASPEFGPFAMDLTNTDANVGEAISVDVPAGTYSHVKYQIKRIEDDVSQPIKNVANVSAFRGALVGNPKRRPSVWIEGTIGVGSDDVGFSSCVDFKFVADHRWEIRIPLNSAQMSSSTMNAVVFFDFEAAFAAALAAQSATAQSLVAEVGTGSVDNMGAAYLDGRTKDPDYGTPIAKAITAALPANVSVFTQSADAPIKFDDNPSVSDQVNSTAPNGTTVIDDSATRVSGDDNPSVSDLSENI